MMFSLLASAGSSVMDVTGFGLDPYKFIPERKNITCRSYYLLENYERGIKIRSEKWTDGTMFYY